MVLRSLIAAIVAGTIGLANHVSAQSPLGAPAATTSTTSTCSEGWNAGSMGSFGVASPTGPFVSLSVARACGKMFPSFRGPLASVDIGAHGARMSLGWISWIEATGVQARVSALRTWGSPWRVAANQTFVGPEIRASLALTFGVGTYSRVSASGPGADRFTAFSVSMPF